MRVGSEEWERELQRPPRLLPLIQGFVPLVRFIVLVVAVCVAAIVLLSWF